MNLPAPGSGWTCPFCTLLCDGFGLRAEGQALALDGGDCMRAQAALAQLGAVNVQPQVAGAAAAWDDAIDRAAQVLRSSRAPLVAGLATDVAGARAAYRLAARVGAVCDHAHGDALMHGVRALQDRGQYTATLAEVRERAALIVCVGCDPAQRFPLFWQRIGSHRAEGPPRELVFLGAGGSVPAGVASRPVAAADLFAALQTLSALVAQQRVRNADPALQELAEQLRASPYSVLVWEASTLPAHGALIVEAIGRIVNTLNGHTRAASFGLGGNDGAASAHQVFAWLSGLPLRTRLGATLEHDPLRFAAQRALQDGSADALLWIASFTPDLAPPVAGVPTVVLGHPALAAKVPWADVFIPVATPGIGAAGHLFRTDGTIVLPLAAARDDGLPTVTDVIDRLLAKVGDA
jgi:formylmethanofuran dehydrogenase subunit B